MSDTMKMMRAPTMRWLWTGLAGTVLLVLAAAPALAQERVMYVDIERVLSTSKVGQDIGRQMRNRQEEVTGDFREKGEALQKEQEDLEKQRGVLSADVFQRRVGEAQEKEATLRAEIYQEQQRMQAEVRGAYEDVQKTLNTILGRILEERNLDMILHRGGILVATPDGDLTSEVLAALDRELSKLPLPPR